jgi:2-methylcitrate dehydratase
MLVSVAVALIDGDVTVQSFDEARFLDDDVLDLIRRTTVEISDEFSSQSPAIRNNRLEATDKAGVVHTAHLSLTSADIERGPTDEQIEGKFMRLTRPFMPPKAQHELFDVLNHLDSLDRVSDAIERTAI